MNAELDHYSELPTEQESSSILISTQDPITLYNKFVRIYNSDNKVDDITLKYMTPSKVVQFVHNYVRNYLGILVLILIFALLPAINILYYVLLWISWIKISKNLIIFNDNRKMVLDPFQNMIENEGICEMMKSDYWQFNMDIKETEGLHFAQSVKEMIKQRSNGNNKIKFTVYSPQLKEQYYGYPNARLTYFKWIILCTIIIIAQLILIVIFFKDL